MALPIFSQMALMIPSLVPMAANCAMFWRSTSLQASDGESIILVSFAVAFFLCCNDGPPRDGNGGAKYNELVRRILTCESLHAISGELVVLTLKFTTN